LFTGFEGSGILAEILLENVVAEFPIYGAQPSLRKALFGRAVGGLLKRSDETNKRVVVRALDNVSLKLNHGDRVGIIGHNGAGKSTMLRVLAGIYQPNQGSINIDGRVSPLFNTSPGMDGDDTGYENIVTCGLLLGMTRTEIERKLPEIEAFTELSDYLALPTRTYSSGMLVRLGFAIATAIDPEILLLDEGLGAGDARFAKRAATRVEALIGRSSIMVLASHSDELIRQMCSRAILLEHGRVVADGPTQDILDIYAGMNRVEPTHQPSPVENVEAGQVALSPRETAA
jgi:ABC-type polysaccharide/polyol phosphate transport system ATPase subunit